MSVTDLLFAAGGAGLLFGVSFWAWTQLRQATPRIRIIVVSATAVAGLVGLGLHWDSQQRQVELATIRSQVFPVMGGLGSETFVERLRSSRLNDCSHESQMTQCLEKQKGIADELIRAATQALSVLEAAEVAPWHSDNLRLRTAVIKYAEVSLAAGQSLSRLEPPQPFQVTRKCSVFDQVLGSGTVGETCFEMQYDRAWFSTLEVPELAQVEAQLDVIDALDRAG